MSQFRKILEEREKAQAQRVVAERAAATESAAAEKAFLASFEDAINRIARPLFEEFVQEVGASNYAAHVLADQDAYGNPTFKVSFLPVAHTPFPPNSLQGASFVLKGVVSDQKVEHAMYLGQRSGRQGDTKRSYGLASINRDVLSRELAELLTTALDAQEGR